ncbi:MAG TPA: hypothetical protein VMQ58_01000 [Candidatus Saccharimonadales bacterium]|nr:hypothetical protein [Candidatus Saccharimonadales bacterium]
MILSTILLALGFAWLMVETDWLRIRLPYGSIPVQSIEQRKHRPSFELSRATQVKTCQYPETKLLAEFCKSTEIQNKVVKEAWKHREPNSIFSSRFRNSYQQMIIGGHKVILLATSSKLYDTIAEIQKTADSKPRKFVAKSPPLPLFVETVSIGSHRELDDNPIYRHPINRIVNDYTTVFHDCLCGKEWLEAHYNDHKDFEPTIELTVNEKSISFNGDYKTGVIKQWIKDNRSVNA